MFTLVTLETSTAHGSAALYRDGRPVDVREFVSDRAHNSAIFPPLSALVAQAAGLEFIVVGTGPGSYSGIRVGISAAIGLGVALGVPVIGIPSLCALPAGFNEERYAVTGNARRGAWWYAEVHRGILQAPPLVDEEPEISRLTGLWTGRLLTTDEVSPPFCEAHPATARADVLAIRASALTEEAFERLSAEEVEPVYLRAPFITQSKKPVFR